MARSAILAASLLFSIAVAQAKVLVFWQEGFPTVESEPVPKTTLAQSLSLLDPVFAGMDELRKPEALQDCDLLILPYGSALPADLWLQIHDYLKSGGNILTIGGRPLFVPVFLENRTFVEGRPQNTYSRQIGVAHTYEVPPRDFNRFAWDESYPSFSAVDVRARRVFVAGMDWIRGDYRGLGFFLDAQQERVAAPVVREDYISSQPNGYMGARCVFLNFDPEPGYWSSPAGISLIRDAAEHASRGATLFRVELQNATLAQGEIPQAVVYFRNAKRQRRGIEQTGWVRIELLDGASTIASLRVDCGGQAVAANIALPQVPHPGLYVIRATYAERGKDREVYQTGVWRRDEKLLKSGPSLKANGTYFRSGGTPFIPFGTNYFSTDVYQAGFADGNAYVWERDFAEMEKDGVTFVRTGIWNNHADLIDRITGGVKEQFLRGLEAYLHSASRHHIHVNFTCYAFDPQTVRRFPGETPLQFGPGSNPYTDPAAVRAQKDFVQSIVDRFKDLPNLSWDLINEPSFSNPKRLWKGNTPNADLTEKSAWNRWLEKRFGSPERLAQAWGTSAEDLGSFGDIPLPEPEHLDAARADNPNQVRAFDYNLFAQEMFGNWTSEMISAIHATGSRQLVNVGQDEGGVSDRVLNQFYGSSGVAFTANHTWWRDDALLWDSVAAKRPGLPNIVGETGVQPAWLMDASWRYDELTALGLFERKLALGLAAANSGSLQWDWSHEDVFGIKRSDGSNKIWLDVLRGIAGFAEKAKAYMTGVKNPDAAIVLPQSFQLSVYNKYAVDAQQACVRALFHHARATAYVVGEYQIQLLDNPKLIILPSPWTLSESGWKALLTKVREGATLLVSGRFDADEHFHATRRHSEAGIEYSPGLLSTRENLVRWPEGQALLSYGGDKCTFLERGFLASGETFVEKVVGKGVILYFSLPLELNDNLKAIGEIYSMALAKAGVTPAYATDLQDPGILICPTAAERSTLYVLTSESSSLNTVTFKDAACGKLFRGKLAPGRAALLLVGKDGQLLAKYNWDATTY